jgi:hypothetical protein
MIVDRRQLSYVLKFIVLCWVAIAVIIAIVVGLARILKNTALTVIVAQVVIYSCMFGYLGWQQYKWGRQKDNKSWRGRRSAESEDTEESDSGWK